MFFHRDNLLVISPQVPPGKWQYFCLDRVRYHKRWITILWDETGRQYGRGQGLRVYVDGALVGQATELKRLRVKMPPPVSPSAPASATTATVSATPALTKVI
jgi:hypothetical protein